MFWKRNVKAELQGHKRVVIKGQAFIIRKINPLIDFSADRMPQIFAHMVSRRAPSGTPMEDAKALKDMMAIVEAGVVGIDTGRDLLPLVEIGKGQARGREAGITVEDLFRDQEAGVLLFQEVFSHTLDRFRGMQKVFFWLKTKLFASMLLRRSTARLPILSPSQMGV